MKYILIVSSILIVGAVSCAQQSQSPNSDTYTSNPSTTEISEQTNDILSNTLTISIPVNYDPITQPDDPVLSKEWAEIFEIQYSSYMKFMAAHLSEMSKFVDVNGDGRIDIRTGDQILTRVVNVKRGVASFEKGKYEENSWLSGGGVDCKSYSVDSKLAKAFLYDNFYLFKLYNSDLFYERVESINKREKHNKDIERQRVWDAYK